MSVAMQAAAAPPAQDPAALQAIAEKRARIAKTAHDFEASYLSVMMGQMMQGVSTGDEGGEQTAMFKSFLTDAMAKSMARQGGVGLSHAIEQEMLKLQGLTQMGAKP